jgi:transposase-like protein
MGANTGISASEVSQICQTLDEEVAAFRDRSISHIAFPYVLVDATRGTSKTNAATCPKAPCRTLPRHRTR